MSFFVTTPQRQPLSELLGGGIARGLETGLARKASLSEKLALAEQQQKALAEKPLTPYQQILTQQREKDIQRQISSYTGNLLREDIKLGTIEPLEKARIDRSALRLARQGLDFPQAASQAIQENMVRKEFLGTIDIPKSSRKESDKQKLINTLRENEITDIYDISQLMKAKKWKGKDIQEVYSRLIKPIKKMKEAPAVKGKIKFNPQNTEHIRRAREILEKTKGDRAKANKILSREFTL